MGSYRIPFVSLTGNEYEVRIYPREEGYSESGATVLRGGSKPLTTDEQGGNDILVPVRGSTGYVGIETEDYGLMERLMPTTADGMRVTLVRHARADETEQADSVAWEGYVRPEAFTQEWCAGPWGIQVPVISHLGMVMDDYLSDGNTGLLTVREWLARVCGDVYKWVLIPYDELAENGTMQWGEDTLPTPTALQLAFCEELFKMPVALAERDDPTDTTRGLWDGGTNRDIAGSLATVLRWVFREDGDRLVCSDPSGTATHYLRYSVASLLEESPEADGMETVQSVYMEELGGSWSDTHLGGDDGTKDVLLPWGRVSVTGGAGKFDATLLSAGDEEWEKVGGIPLVNGGTEGMNRPDTVPFEIYGDSSCTIKSQRVLDNVEYEATRYTAKEIFVDRGTSAETYAAGNNMDEPPMPGMRNLGGTSMIYGNCFPYVVFGLNASEMPHGDYFGGGEIAAIHYFYSRNGSYVHYRINSIILGHLPLNVRHRPAVKLRTTLAQLLPYSSRQVGAIVLKLSGQVHRGMTYKDIDMAYGFDDEGPFGMEVSVKVGKYYIYKDTWGTHQCVLTETEAPFDILWTKANNNGFTENLKISMTDGCPMTLDDTIEITLYTPSDAERDPNKTIDNDCKYLRIDNFRVEVTEYELPESYDTRETLIAEADTTVNLSERIGTNKTEEGTLTTSFGGTDNPGALIAAIPVTISGAKTSHMQARKVGTLEGENDGARYLCKRTMAWMAKQGASTRHALKVPLRAERPWSLPVPFLVNDDERTYYPAAASRNWRDDKVMLTMVEVRT